MTKRIITLVCFFILFIAIGCSVGKDYSRPEINIPEKYYSGRSDSLHNNIATSNYSDIEWRNFFRDSVLISLIDTALKNNFDIKRAAKNIEIASEQLKQSRANFYPTVDARAFDFLREYHSENWYSNPSSNYYDGRRQPPRSFYTNRVNYASVMSSSWEIDVWGKFRRQKEAAQAEFIRSNEFKKAVQTALISELAFNYYNLLMLNAQLDVARTNLALNDSTLTIVKLQYSSGQVTALAIQQTEAQKLVAASLIPQIERDYTVSENRINELLGRYPQQIQINTNLENTEPHKLYSAGVPTELLRNRPDVVASEQALIAANAQVGVAQAMRYPSFNIGASLGLDAMVLSNFLDPIGSGFAAISGSLLQPIFQNRRLKTNYRIAVAENEIAEMNFLENIIQAVNEVSNAMVTLQKLEEEYVIAQDRITVSQKGVRSASLLFRSGMANYLEVITAQRTALETELDLVNIRMQILSANIELYRSLGGGWK